VLLDEVELPNANVVEFDRHPDLLPSAAHAPLATPLSYLASACQLVRMGNRADGSLMRVGPLKHPGWCAEDQSALGSVTTNRAPSPSEEAMVTVPM
jgi:hypothetical protein